MVKLVLKSQHHCRCNNNLFIFEKSGGEVFFKVDGKLTGDLKYLAFELENKNDFSARIEIHLYKKIFDGDDVMDKRPDFSITTGVLPFIKTTAEIPLSYLDGQKLFGARRKGILKTVVNGKRMNLADIAYVGIKTARCHVLRRFLLTIPPPPYKYDWHCPGRYGVPISVRRRAVP